MVVLPTHPGSRSSSVNSLKLAISVVQRVDMVKAGVPAAQWGDGKHTQAETHAAKENRMGFFTRMFGG